MKTKVFITLLVLALIAVYYFLGTGYLKQRQEQATLSSQIADTAQTLAQMPEPPQDLEQRLAVAEASLAAEQSTLPDEINSTRAINAILELADECNVKAIPLVTDPWSAVKVGEHDYYVFRLNISATGNFTQLVSFTDKLENGKLETLILEDLSVSRTPGQPGEVVPENKIPVTASLNLAIYTLPRTND